MIIGIVGKIASGKGVVAKELEKRGFSKLTFSDILRQELTVRGVELTRKNLQDLGDEMRQKHGAGYLAERLLEKVEKGKHYVLEGIRNPKEIEALRKFGDCCIVGIEAPLERRFQWIMMRGKENDPHTLDEVKAIDDRDGGKGEPDWGLQVEKSFAIADVVIKNDKTREHLVKSIEKMLKKIAKA